MAQDLPFEVKIRILQTPGMLKSDWYNCMYISKDWHLAAKELFYANVVISNNVNTLSFLRCLELGGFRSLIRSLTISSNIRRTHLSGDDLRTILHYCNQLEQISFIYINPFDLLSEVGKIALPRLKEIKVDWFQLQQPRKGLKKRFYTAVHRHRNTIESIYMPPITGVQDEDQIVVVANGEDKRYNEDEFKREFSNLKYFHHHGQIL